MLYVWLLLSCGTAHAHAIDVRPRDVKIRGIAAPVRIYESQDAALDAAIETDSDPFGACCWPSAVVAARARGTRRGGAPRPRTRRGHGPGVGGRREARRRRRRDGRVRPLPRAAAARGGSIACVERATCDSAVYAHGSIALGDFDVVVAADTLYEEAIARATARVVRASRGACIDRSTRCQISDSASVFNVLGV